MAIPDSRQRLTKEMIKDRMKKHASELWGRQLSEIESFDPIIEMIMGACASELKRIHDEIAASQGRILERIAQLLTPDVLAGPLPAHSILHAIPNEPTHFIDPDTQFYHNMEEEGQMQSLYFSPISSFPIFRTSLTHLAHTKHLWKLEGLNQEELLVAERQKFFHTTSLFLGLEVAPEVTSLDGLNFYWDWKTEDLSQKQQMLNLLPSAKWSINGTSLLPKMGLQIEEEIQQKGGATEVLTDSLTHTAHLQLHIEEYYKDHFLSLEFPSDFGELADQKSVYPEAFREVFPAGALAELSQSLLWIRVDFPEAYPQEAFNQLTVLPNCFPIYNCRLHTFSYRLQQKTNIMPLETEDFFFDINEVSRSDGEKYTPVASVHLTEDSPKTYTLRKGGTARFDPRDAASIMDYIFDLLRDESAAFSALGYDVLSSDIKNLNQIISRLERKVVKKKTHTDRLTYLVIRPERTGENIDVTFRSTAGEKGNKLRSGMGLGVYQGKGASFKKGSIFLVSRCTGGRDSLSPTESLHAYKEALLNRGRIVSFADIETVCFSRLGSRLKSVKIERGIKISEEPGQGLIRTLDIYLESHAGIPLTEEDCQDLQTVLSLRSTSLLPFQVFIVQQAISHT